ncbi:serine protease [candidate division LCP-89 bacterium B3_LCP]|uniref:Serine protease n=1 Tax=candidate division LCP-89 bacterium B3_LCP TaxID=2012998 RepID=A0A532UUD1_UNCL8|nr:MAG: serine protease [candidate division LCP-89 bacterium B3_LCP]
MSDGFSSTPRLQYLRNFTVQIRIAGTDTIVGTGVAVPPDGKVVTCAHVIKAALGFHPRKAGKRKVGVYYPQLRGDDRKDYQAKVAACFREYDDDLVLLQLTDGPSPLTLQQMPVLGTAEDSQGNPFRSYGYHRLAHYIGGWADGDISGPVDCPEDGNFQAEPVQLESSQINRGMSGAAVLDKERNLVIGVVSETWFPDESTKDRDTAWAVNARVLKLDPLNLPVQDEPHPKRPAPKPRIDAEEARRAVAPDLQPVWNNAPPSLDEWVGRAELLKDLSADWSNPNLRVTGLIGFGGEGKSSLVRRWVDDLLKDSSQIQPDGIFWWGFYEKPSVEEFFEAALRYLSGGRIDTSKLPSSSLKAQVISAMLDVGRYLFILDGLEVMQHQGGDRYGLLKSKDLRDFLGYFSSPDHNSFCLITSRAPVHDLMEYVTYVQRDVTCMHPADGRALLRKVGVEKGKDDELDRVVSECDGHALSLSLLGSFLADQYSGDISKASEIPQPTDEITQQASPKQYDHVHRILRRYDENLTKPGRAFLTLFSAFRLPVEESALEKVFRAPGELSLQASITTLSEKKFKAMITRLLTARILRFDTSLGQYTVHPLIRNHYQERFEDHDPEQQKEAHLLIRDYYLEMGGDVPRHPTLDNLIPFIEAVHHCCFSGEYNQAYQIQIEHIFQYDRRVVAHELGAYETILSIMFDFFPDGDTLQDPLVKNPGDKGWILNTVGFCLMSLGRLNEAAPFMERASKKVIELKDWHNASVGYRNLADLYASIGDLSASLDSAEEALILANREEDSVEKRVDIRNSLVWKAWVAHLSGNLQEAGDDFKRAETLEREDDSSVNYLYGLRGFMHAHHLRRYDDATYSRKVIAANLIVCEEERYVNSVSRCHRMLGDLDADEGQYDSARDHYDKALRIARGITFLPALIEALLARGRWYAKYRSDPQVAFSDLEEALEYALDSGYKIYEADIRIALAWAHYAAGDPTAARAEAERALRESEKMGYHWGKLDSEEILGKLEE